jgi:hypothetical protein
MWEPQHLATLRASTVCTGITLHIQAIRGTLKLLFGNISRFIWNVHYGGLLDVQNVLSADTGISRQI